LGGKLLSDQNFFILKKSFPEFAITLEISELFKVVLLLSKKFDSED
jgi:hypothetical protein